MGFIDTAIGLRVLYLLVQPIKNLPAYKLGLVDEDGNIQRKAKTAEEKAATSMLLRLVLRIRSFLSMIPLAQSKFGKFASAYALVRECIEKENYLPTLGQLDEMEIHISAQDISMCESVIFEDAPANVTGAAIANKDNPMTTVKRKKVSDKTFGNFNAGKMKIKRWGSKLNLEDASDQEILNIIKKNPNGIIVLEDQMGRAKIIKYTKNESNVVKMKPLQVLESRINDEYYECEVVDV